MRKYSLFRIRSDLMIHIKTLRIIIDLSLILYVIIPYSLFLIFEYIAMWRGNSILLGYIRTEHLLFVLCGFVSTGGIRLLVRQGDILFLRQHESLMKRLRYFGLIYSLIQTMVLTFILMILLLPIFMHIYNFIWLHWFMFGVCIVLCRLSLSLMLNRYRAGLAGWKLWLANGITIVIAVMIVYFLFTLFINGSVYIVPSLIGLSMLLIWLFFLRIHRETGFLLDLENEYKERMKFSYLIYRNLLPRIPIIKFRKPLFAKPIFRSRTLINLVTETYIKSFIRNSEAVKYYVQFVVICIYGITQMPTLLKILFLCASVLLLVQWMKYFIEDIWNSDFMKLYRLDNEVADFHARMKAITILGAPFLFANAWVIGIYDGWLVLTIAVVLGTLFQLFGGGVLIYIQMNVGNTNFVNIINRMYAYWLNVKLKRK